MRQPILVTAIEAHKKKKPKDYKLPSLKSIAQDTLYTLFDHLEEVGNVPCELLEPVLARCTCEQLLHFLEFNTGPDWVSFCEPYLKPYVLAHSEYRRLGKSEQVEFVSSIITVGDTPAKTTTLALTNGPAGKAATWHGAAVALDQLKADRAARVQARVRKMTQEQARRKANKRMAVVSVPHVMSSQAKARRMQVVEKKGGWALESRKTGLGKRDGSDCGDGRPNPKRSRLAQVKRQATHHRQILGGGGHKKKVMQKKVAQKVSRLVPGKVEPIGTAATSHTMSTAVIPRVRAIRAPPSFRARVTPASSTQRGQESKARASPQAIKARPALPSSQSQVTKTSGGQSGGKGGDGKGKTNYWAKEVDIFS